MFKFPRKSPHKITDLSPSSDRYIHYLARSIIWIGLLSSPLGLMPLLAAPIPANTSIENQATGSFTDGEDPAALPEDIISNIVKVTVAEVAGITVGIGTPAEAPTSVANAGIFQGDGTVNAGDIVYFDYVITNEGNDPTQFFIPGTPSSSPGGTFSGATNPIQIIAYNPGTGSVAVAINIPTGGGRTGPTTATGTDGLLAKNGIIPSGGTVTIRVPIKVNANAAVGSTVSAIIGKSTVLGANEVYSNSTTNHDLYTQDNVDGTEKPAGTVVETTGMPVNGNGTPGDGIATNHRQESSNIGSTTVMIEPINITGKVFEDVNYGGGAGRDLPTSTGIVRPNVRVELYAADGTYLGATLTDVTGQYKFNQFNVTPATAFTADKSYQVRIVNSFVTSSRTGGCDSTTATLTTAPTPCTQSAVQTFRTSGDTDANNIADADPNRVGGELPAKIDAGANTTNQNLSALTTGNNAVESLTTVTLGTLAVSGVNFGYNFDTIVNTNDSGQGSLRQFITNSNTLTNTGLAQVGKTAGKEVSIFMVPSGTATPGVQASIPSQLTSGVAVINIDTSLPQITDANTSIDGTTQTTNVGDNNNGTFGTGGTVGVDNIPLSKVNKPEVELSDGGLGLANGLEILANDTTVRGISIWGFGKDTSIGRFQNQITVGNLSPISPARTLIEQNIIGTKATDFALTGSPGRSSTTGSLNSGNGVSLIASSNTKIQNNLIGFNAGTGIISSGNNNQLLVTGNELRSNGTEATRDGIGLENGTKNSQAINNLIIDSAANGVSIYKNAANSQLLVENNTIQNSGRNYVEQAGIAAFETTGGNDKISKNIIAGGSGAGIWLEQNVSTMKITQNSIYDNAGLGIDLKGTTLDNGTGNQTILVNTVTPNDGSNTVANIANLGMDYPIITAASVSGNAGVSTLTVKGYVGNIANATNNTFANATIEFFIGAADTNDKGRVFSTDAASVSKLHAEGQTYLGTCTADANGLFGTSAKPCSFTVPAGTAPLKITTTATDTLGNTSEFSPPLASDPNVLLVKRITAINGLPKKFDGSPLNTYDSTSSPYDNNNNTLPNALPPTQKTTSYWPNNATGFILGAVDGGNAKPNDSIEYTIYFLSTGEADAKNVLFCDRVPTNVTFLPIAFSGIAADTSGLSTGDRGIAIGIGGIIKSYTNAADGDIAEYFPPGVNPTTTYPTVNCGGSNTNGAVVVNLGNIPNATGMGVPPESYGLIRFQGRVK
jgi:trimeric autotransporter adhesin